MKNKHIEGQAATISLPKDVVGNPNVKVLEFGQIVQNVTERVSPELADTNAYVGLEHLNSDSIHLKEWGRPTDVIGEKFLFRKGDVIFGRRRAYQRKLAVAEFDGICSAHAMVLRSVPGVIEPDFLPFFISSDVFMDRAIQISVGSLSPTINWSTIKNETFKLPDVGTQKRLSKILWAIDEITERWVGLQTELQQLSLSLFDYSPSVNDSWVRTPLKDLISFGPQYGINASATKLLKDGIRYLRITDIDDRGCLIHDNAVGVAANSKDIEKCMLHPGDVLFARTGSIGKTFLYLDSHPPCVFAGYLIRFRVKKHLMLPEFLFLFTQTNEFLCWVQKTVRVGVQPNINGKEFMELPVPVPTIKQQSDIVSKVSMLKQVMDASSDLVSKLKVIQKKIINTSMEGASVLRK